MIQYTNTITAKGHNTSVLVIHSGTEVGLLCLLSMVMHASLVPCKFHDIWQHLAAPCISWVIICPVWLPGLITELTSQLPVVDVICSHFLLNHSFLAGGSPVLSPLVMLALQKVSLKRCLTSRFFHYTDWGHVSGDLFCICCCHLFSCCTFLSYGIHQSNKLFASGLLPLTFYLVWVKLWTCTVWGTAYLCGIFFR